MLIAVHSFFVLFSTSVFCGKIKGQFPIILVPGFGGSRLESKVTNVSLPFYCPKSENWILSWVSFEDLIFSTCLLQYLKMEYDPKLQKLREKPGFQTRASTFGDVESVACLNPSFCSQSKYFAGIIDHLVQNRGYKSGYDLRAAPYDFRKIGDLIYMKELFDKLTLLIEQSFISKRGKPVILISHSLGAPTITHFLLQKSQKWKNLYIHSHFSIAGAYGGSFKSLETILFGTDPGLPKFLYDKKRFKEITSSFTSLYFLMPSSVVYGKKMVIAQSPFKNYTLDQISQLLFDYDISYAPTVMKLIPKLMLSGDIGVKLACISSEGIDTPIGYQFGDPNGPYKYNSESGDGTVGKLSSEGCNYYASSNSKKSFSFVIHNVSHAAILIDSQIMKYLDNWIDESILIYSKLQRVIQLVKGYFRKVKLLN